ncbi:MAG: hypothetical protein AB1792_00495 [Candidatus Zixiibacteriota bacterium]
MEPGYGFARTDRQLLGIDRVPGFEFPPGSGNDYLYGCRLLFGAVRGVDTLVSETGWPTWPDEYQYELIPVDTIRESSSLLGSPHFSSVAVAEQEYYTSFSDTGTFGSAGGIDYIERRTHRPIGVEVHQATMAAGSGLLAPGIIVDNWIVNVSGEPIASSCIGLWVAPSVSQTVPLGGKDTDDLCGLLTEIPGIVAGTVDSLIMAWAADNDGDPSVTFAPYNDNNPTGAIGIRILRAPKGGRMGFNWWGYYASGNAQWGPSYQRHFGAYAGAPGTPLGDRSRYAIMTNGEVDYDQVRSAEDFSGGGWNPPPSTPDGGRALAGGASAYFILSYGPLPDIAPGDSVPLTYALVAGPHLHTESGNYHNRFEPIDPDPYLARLDFSQLFTNARSIDWFFDTPGVDTDGDGYRGKYHLTNCNTTGTVCDTVWYKGDGIPDWAGPQAPPSPPFEFSTAPHKITLRWNGAIPETSRDQLSRKRDWEGYRVYSSRFDVDDKYELIASWDKPDDFTRWAYQSKTNDWKQMSYPLTIDQWRAAMDDPGFDPLDHSHPSFESAYRDTIIDTVVDVHGEIIEITPRLRYSYWIPEAANRGNRYWGADRWEDNLIQKVGERDTIIDADTLSYGIYEMTLDNLNAAIPLYFAITAYDYGDYVRNVTTLEGSPHANSQYCHLLYSSDVVIDSALQVSVYPNPYKIQFKDAFGDWTSYYREGYEAPGKPVMDERDRRIWFINLPDTAEINIYTLDGDLVRKILHPDPFLTTYPSIVGWDLISRNTQAVVSGIYIWRVDSRLGRQIGKIVIIK